MEDFILLEDQGEGSSKGPYKVGYEVELNGEIYKLTQELKVKTVKDNLGFPSTYSWYKAKGPDGEETNLFFFDGDFDSMEKNNKISEEWWEEAYREYEF